MAAATWKRKPKARKNAVGCEGVAVFKPTMSSVIESIESLYADRLKPAGRIILRRLGERASRCNPEGEVPHIEPSLVRRLCEGCSQLLVHVEPADDYTAIIIGRDQDFVDANSLEDPYPERLWREAEAYFTSVTGNEAAQLPGGRYACAKRLVAEKLPFLKGRCLGEVCHIIALATSKRRLLGYRNGYMVGYAFSELGKRELCAASRQPAKVEGSQYAVADWEQARACLVRILDSNGGAIQLANVKRLFHSQFQLELSETFLGHTRLNELLQDKRFQDVCVVTPQSTGSYLVVKVSPGLEAESPANAEAASLVSEEASWLTTTPPHTDRRGFRATLPSLLLALSSNSVPPPPGLGGDDEEAFDSSCKPLHLCVPPPGMGTYGADADSSAPTESPGWEAWSNSNASSPLDLSLTGEWHEFQGDEDGTDALDDACTKSFGAQSWIDSQSYLPSRLNFGLGVGAFPFPHHNHVSLPQHGFPSPHPYGYGMASDMNPLCSATW